MSSVLLILSTKCVVIPFTLKVKAWYNLCVAFWVISRLLGSPRMLKSNTSFNKHPALTFSLKCISVQLTENLPIWTTSLLDPYTAHHREHSFSFSLESISFSQCQPPHWSKQRSFLAYSPVIAVQLVSLSQLLVPTPIILQRAASNLLKTWMGPGCPTIG